MTNGARRIHLVNVTKNTYSWNPIVVNGRGMDSFGGIEDFVDKNGPIRFSRRKFAGATKVVFKADDEHWYNGAHNCTVPTFVARVNGFNKPIEVCGSKARWYFGVTKNTKKVTVWYKKVDA